MAGEGGKLVGTLKFTVEVYEQGPPVVWLARKLPGSRAHVSLPKALVEQLEAYALEVVKG